MPQGGLLFHRALSKLPVWRNLGTPTQDTAPFLFALHTGLWVRLDLHKALSTLVQIQLGSPTL